MGSSKSAPQVQAPDPVATAKANVDAQIAGLGPAMQAYYNAYSNPTYGALPQTQFNEQIRQTVYPEESRVRNQLTQNIMAALQSPTGITPEQQASIDASRALAQSRLIEAMRTRANLGGGLYGGRTGAAEARSVGELQGGFAEADINRESAARQNALNSGFSLLSMLYPDVNITQPNYINPVPSAETTYQGQLSANQYNAQAALQQQANQNALYSSLFQGLGTAAGGWLGGLGKAASTISKTG